MGTEVTLSKGFVPPPPPTATKLVIDSVVRRITTHLVDSTGADVPGSAYTYEEDVTSDATQAAAALAAAQAAVPNKVPA